MLRGVVVVVVVRGGAIMCFYGYTAQNHRVVLVKRTTFVRRHQFHTTQHVFNRAKSLNVNQGMHTQDTSTHKHTYVCDRRDWQEVRWGERRQEFQTHGGVERNRGNHPPRDNDKT